MISMPKNTCIIVGWVLSQTFWVFTAPKCKPLMWVGRNPVFFLFSGLKKRRKPVFFINPVFLLGADK